MKICTKCGQERPVEEFAKSGKYRRSDCGDCSRAACREYGIANRSRRNARLRAWRRANPIAAQVLDRRARLKRKYNLTVEQADALLASNEGRCWICNDAPSAAIDHDHQTGQVRGALCLSCNTFLGRVEANPAILPGIGSYLDAPCHADVLLEIANA